MTQVVRRALGDPEAIGASRHYWDGAAADYQAEHGEFLGDARFVWCPESLDEADARLLGDVRGATVLEVGSGAAQCSRWLLSRGARVVAVDLSLEQLRQAASLDARHGLPVPAAVADALRLPFPDASFDVAFSAYGAPQFVADAAGLQREVARVLRPGGRWVFSVTHPLRWCFPDDPGPDGLVARDSYFDRRPYVEQDDDGVATYAEHHRTVGDRIRDVVGAGMALVDLVEPEWPQGHTREWGQWSPARGRVIPGTAIFSCRLPG